MLVGNPSIFALESKITKAFERPSQLALGFFTILIKGERYGVHEPDATLLAVSFDEVCRRLHGRGTHLAPFCDANSGVIAHAYRAAIYGKEFGTPYPDMTPNDFATSINRSRIGWAPDGDEAFDDGSYVLQFDTQDRVRLIAFKTRPDGRYDPETMNDLYLSSDEFYGVLQCWQAEFLSEWKALPKEKH
jgi:Immunity protein 42